MRTRVVLATAMLGLALAVVVSSTQGGGRVDPSSDRRPPVSDLLAALPLAFEPRGDGYLSRGPGYSVVLTPTETVMRLRPGRELRMRLVGANPAPTLEGRRPLGSTTNYLVGDDPSGWRSDVATYAEVEYGDVYPGVDLVFHGNQRRLEHDFVVAPGADPASVEVEFDAERVEIDGRGDLVATVDGGPVRLDRPLLYQDGAGGRRPVPGRYVIREANRIGFEVGPYDRTLPLVIDPILATSTYLGGSGMDAASGVDVDGAGNIYLTGSTESADLATTGPIQARLNQDGSGGRPDAFVTKINAGAGSVAYTTYLGGTNRDVGTAVAVATDGSAYVTGVTESPDFPTARPVQGAFGGGAGDAFAVKLGPDGSRLEYGTFLGGAEPDDGRGIAVDRFGAAYVTGSTSSIAFPSVGPLQPGPGRPDVDAFVTKIDAAGSAFEYSSRLGGSNEDHGVDIAVDDTGSAVVTGDTRSPAFPTARPLQPGSGGSAGGVAGSFADAFVTKLDPAGTGFVYSTFLGGGDTDLGTGIALDSQGNAYVAGTTSSTDFPTAGTPVQARKDGDTDAFVSKIDTNGSVLVYSSYLGGNGADSAAGVAVGNGGVASVVGTAASANFPTAGPTQAAKAGGQTDAFVAQFDTAGSVLVYSSYLGGRDDDQGAGVAVGPNGTAVAVGLTNSPDFRTANPIQAARNGSSSDAFLLTVSEVQAAPPAEGTTGGGGTSAHQRRIRFLVATTAALFLAAVLHTAYLRRRAATEPEWQGPTIPAPPPRETVGGGGVRVLDDGDDDRVFAADAATTDGVEEEPVTEVVPPAPATRKPTKSEKHAKNRKPAPVRFSDRPRDPEQIPVPDLLEETRAVDTSAWWDEDPDDLVLPEPAGPPRITPLPRPAKASPTRPPLPPVVSAPPPPPPAPPPPAAPPPPPAPAPPPPAPAPPPPPAPAPPPPAPAPPPPAPAPPPPPAAAPPPPPAPAPPPPARPAPPPPAPPAPPPARPAPPPPAPPAPIPPVPAEDLSFWDLFPEDLPVPPRDTAAPADPWAPDYPAEDLLAARHPQPSPPPPTPDDDVFWAAPSSGPEPQAAPEPAGDLLITEFLDAAPDAPTTVPRPDPEELDELLGDVDLTGFGGPRRGSPADAAAGEQQVRKRKRARRSGRRKRPDG